MNPLEHQKIDSFPLHILDENKFHLLWFVKGDCSAHINFDIVNIKSNTLVFLSPGEVLTINCEFYGVEKISFNGHFFESSTNLISSIFNKKLYEGIAPISKICFKGENSKPITTLFNRIAQENIKEKPDLIIQKSFLDNILMESMTIRMKHNFKYLSKLDKYIEEQYTETHSVADYAEQLETRPKDLLGILNNLGAQKPSKVIKERVLLEAKKLLVYTAKSARDIAFDVGFDDPAYFARFFKKNTGFTAQGFRADYRNQIK